MQRLSFIIELRFIFALCVSVSGAACFAQFLSKGQYNKLVSRLEESV